MTLPKETDDEIKGKFGNVISVDNFATYLKNSDSENYDYITTFSPQTRGAESKYYFKSMKANKTRGDLVIKKSRDDKGSILKINNREDINRLTTAFEIYKRTGKNKFLRDNLEEHRIPEIWPRFYYFPSSGIKFNGGGKFSTNNREIKFNTDLNYISTSDNQMTLPKEADVDIKSKFGNVINVNNFATYLKNSDNENYDYITTFSPQNKGAESKNYFKSMKANKTKGDLVISKSRDDKGLILKVNSREDIDRLTTAFGIYKRTGKNKFLGDNVEEHRISTVKIE